MEVKEILCMKKGGENGYAQNAGLITLKVGAKTQQIVEKAAESVLKESFSKFPNDDQVLVNVADLGCGFGPQPLEFMSTVIRTVARKYSESTSTHNSQVIVPEIQFYLNDLVGNDFNSLFKKLPIVQEKHKDVPWFALGAPGSFHGRLFPRNFIHFFHSCYSLHWLSKAPIITDERGLPLNNGKVYISKTSPPAVAKAYISQFQQDFSSILKFRSQELAPNGRMVLVLNGRLYADPADKDVCHLWDVLAEAASYLVSQGLIEKEKLDSFNVPFYNPSKDEVQYLLDKEDSLATEFIDRIVSEIGDENFLPNPKCRMKCYRSFSEPIVSNQFGADVMDELYDKATHILDEHVRKGNAATKQISIVAVLKKK